MKFFHVRGEGEVRESGFNFYPKGKTQVGFVLRLWQYYFQCRYSRYTRRWYVGFF